MRDNDRHHELVEVDLWTLKKGIVGRRRGRQERHDLVGYASNEAMKAQFIPDNTFFLVESDEVFVSRGKEWNRNFRSGLMCGQWFAAYTKTPALSTLAL